VLHVVLSASSGAPHCNGWNPPGIPSPPVNPGCHPAPSQADVCCQSRHHYDMPALHLVDRGVHAHEVVQAALPRAADVHAGLLAHEAQALEDLAVAVSTISQACSGCADALRRHVCAPPSLMRASSATHSIRQAVWARQCPQHVIGTCSLCVQSPAVRLHTCTCSYPCICSAAAAIVWAPRT
jgi:hypothetical protein